MCSCLCPRQGACRCCPCHRTQTLAQCAPWGPLFQSAVPPIAQDQGHGLESEHALVRDTLLDVKSDVGRWLTARRSSIRRSGLNSQGVPPFNSKVICSRQVKAPGIDPPPWRDAQHQLGAHTRWYVANVPGTLHLNLIACLDCVRDKPVGEHERKCREQNLH